MVKDDGWAHVSNQDSFSCCAPVESPHCVLGKIATILSYLKVRLSTNFQLRSLMDLSWRTHGITLGLCRVFASFIGFGQLLQVNCVMQDGHVLSSWVNRILLVNSHHRLRRRLANCLTPITLHPLLTLRCASSLLLLDMMFWTDDSFRPRSFLGSCYHKLLARLRSISCCSSRLHHEGL